MAFLIRSLIRLARSKSRHPDEEHAPTADPVKTSSDLHHIYTTTTGTNPHPHPHHHQHSTTTTTPSSAGSALALFRLTLGITATPHLGFTSHTPGLRPADNLGLYARVTHSEQTAKSNYKLFSGIINACYFLQIIVAAALTALGAANANNKAVTAFGAINTIVAGLLAYLKGSGYPARLKYYANEWKKVREFIEHRERDFSLEGGCGLDVGEVVAEVRGMYERTKREIEMNTPDSYTSVGRGGPGGPGGGGDVGGVRFEGVDVAKAEAIAAKLRGLDETVRKLRGHVPEKGGDVVDKLRGLEDTVRRLRGDVSEGVESKADEVGAKLRSVEDALEKEMTARVDKVVDEGHDAVDNTVLAIQDEEKRVMAELRGVGKAVVREVEEHKPRPPQVSIALSHGGNNDQR